MKGTEYFVGALLMGGSVQKIIHYFLFVSLFLFNLKIVI